MPPSDGRLSVFRIIGLSADRIWTLGRLLVAAPSGRSLKGRADIGVEDVEATRLRVIPDRRYRHCDVTGWPAEKSARQLRAMELARESRGHVR